MLLRYQLALDQLASGHLTEARVLLEDGLRRHGHRAELVLLLAYVLEREGRTTEARQRLAPIAKTSPVAAAYLAALSGAPPVGGSVGGSPGQDTGAADTPQVEAPRLDQPNAKLLRLERVLAQLVNAERAKAGLDALTLDEKLSSVARSHSAEMRDRQYFAHESPIRARRAPLDRYQAVFGTYPSMIAENVFRAWGSRHEPDEDDVRKAHQGLMNSPGHRANILRPGVTRLGIGLAANANGDIWVTQM
ncbi:MAG: CAP domain-containing protein, partial [Armatimonadota bacterium]|nr:CAP domain-containing protein [Armatimonadota bacterium]